jgi:hypothetical protein
MEDCNWKTHGDGEDDGLETWLEIMRVGFPWAGPMLFLDCETLTGAKDGQGLRFGTYQYRGYRYDWRVTDAHDETLTREKLDRVWVRTRELHSRGNCRA